MPNARPGSQECVQSPHVAGARKRRVQTAHAAKSQGRVITENPYQGIEDDSKEISNDEELLHT